MLKRFQQPRRFARNKENKGCKAPQPNPPNLKSSAGWGGGEGIGLFLVTVWVHILLPGICTQTFPRVDLPHPNLHKKFQKKKNGFKRLAPTELSFLRGVLASVRSAQGEGSGCTDHPSPFCPPKRALGPGKRIASPGRGSPSGLRLAGAPLPSTRLPILKRRRGPPSRLRREPPKGQGAEASGARRSGPQGRCPPSPGGKALSPSRLYS